MLFAQITDLHCTAAGMRAARGQVDTNLRLEQVIRHLNRMTPRPAFVIVTGDLANGPEPGEYETLGRLLPRLAMPVYAIPGNHDDRAEMRRLFAGRPWMPQVGEFVQFTVDLGGLRLIALDTLVPGETGGLLCARRLHWLETQLAAHPGPTVIAMHHPPFATGVRFMDRVRCRGAEELADLVARHGNVERIICGHVHRTVTVRFAGTIAAAALATAHQLGLDLGPDAPPTWTLEPPAVTLHLWRPEIGLTTHTQLVGDHQPRPFA